MASLMGAGASAYRSRSSANDGPGQRNRGEPGKLLERICQRSEPPASLNRFRELGDSVRPWRLSRPGSQKAVDWELLEWTVAGAVLAKVRDCSLLPLFLRVVRHPPRARCHASQIRTAKEELATPMAEKGSALRGMTCLEHVVLRKPSLQSHFAGRFEVVGPGLGIKPTRRPIFATTPA
jgi:hypothetical protein